MFIENNTEVLTYKFIEKQHIGINR